MFKKTKIAEDKIKMVSLDEFDLWMETDPREAERKYCTFLDEGKLRLRYSICRLYNFFSKNIAKSARWKANGLESYVKAPA